MSSSVDSDEYAFRIEASIREQDTDALSLVPERQWRSPAGSLGNTRKSPTSISNIPNQDKSDVLAWNGQQEDEEDEEMTRDVQERAVYEDSKKKGVSLSLGGGACKVHAVSYQVIALVAAWRRVVVGRRSTFRPNTWGRFSPHITFGWLPSGRTHLRWLWALPECNFLAPF